MFSQETKITDGAVKSIMRCIARAYKFVTPKTSPSDRSTTLRKTTSALLLISLTFAPFGPIFAQVAASSDSKITRATDQSLSKPLTAADLDAKPSSTSDKALPEPQAKAAPVMDFSAKSGEQPAKEKDDSQESAPDALATEGPQTPDFNFQIQTQPQATIDQSTGALVYEYPIEMPEGRNGMTPELSLRYNSRNITIPDSIVGLGWELSVPYIQREPLRGTQNLYTKPFFSSTLSGNLIATTDASLSPYTRYRPESDGGDYLQYVFNGNNTWTVTDKDGRTYTFGGGAESRQDNPADPSKVYRWMVSKIADANGNQIRYSYTKDQGQIYPSQILYTYHASAPAAHTITFAYTTPENYGATTYNAAFPVVTRRLLSTITVKTTVSTDSTTDTYTLSYSDAQFIKQKLLESVERVTDFAAAEYHQFFNDTTSFNYSTKAPGWEQGTHSLPSYVRDRNDTLIRDIYRADFDLNGYPDLLISNRVESSQYNYLLMNTGAAFIDSGASWSLPPVDLSSNYAIADINGDHLPDLQPRFFEVYETPPIYLNTGSGFTADNSGTWFIKNYVPEVSNCGPNVGDSESYDTNTFLYDINHDGRNDIVYFGGDKNFKVYLNNGTGWTQSSAYTFTINPGSNYDFSKHCSATRNYQALLDMNGDGLEDYVHQSYGVYLNTGSGFAYNAAYFLDQDSMDRSGLADINGDNLIDFISFKTYDRGNRCARVFMNNGAGWTMVNPTEFPPCENSGVWTPWELNYTDNHQERIGTLMDVTGDGFPDIVGSYMTSVTGKVRAINDAHSSWVENPIPGDPWGPVITPYKGVFFDINVDGVLDFVTSEATWDGVEQAASRVYMGRPAVPNRLTQITSPLGAQTAVEYGTSPTDYSDRDVTPLPVVKKLTVQNVGHGQPSKVIRYDYAGGAYVTDPATAQRRFAGFHKVTTTESGSDLAALRVTETYFHQANGSDPATNEPPDTSLALIGKPYYTVVKHPSGTPKKETWQKYGRHILVTEPAVGRISVFAYPSETVTRITESGATTGMAQAYVYDASLGEQTRLQDMGFVTVNSDGSFTDVPGDTRYIYTEYAASEGRTIVRPSRVDVRQGQSISKTVSRTEYFYDGQIFGVLGSRGNLTKESRWIAGNGATTAETTYTYDSFGNVFTATNPRGAVTKYAYDITKSLVASEKNHLGQTTSYQYLTGKLRQITDPNKNVTTFGYSNRGWLYRVTKPTNAGNRRLRQWLDRENDTWLIVRTDQPVVARREDTTWQSLDNLGRPVRFIGERRNHTTNVLNGLYLREVRTYDALGREVKRSAPYGLPGDAIENLLGTAVPPNLVTTTTLDIFNRPTLIVNSIGKTAISYAGPETLTTDANGKNKRARTDAYGSLVEVKEYNGAETYATRYTYDVRGLLTGITDALGNVRRFTYNNAGWLTASQDLHAPGDSSFGTTSFTYDAAGNQIKEVQPIGTTVDRVYDLLDRLTSVSEATDPSPEFTYTYDSCVKGVGRLCAVSGISNGFTLSKSFVYGPSMPSSVRLTTLDVSFTTNYQYNLSDEVSQIKHPDGTTVRYDFGDWALPSTVYLTLPGGTETTFAAAEYHHTFQPGKVTTFNGLTMSYAYDAAKFYRKASSKVVRGSSILQSYAYSYDNLNNVTRVVEPGLTKTYTYDDLSRLTKAVHTPSAGSSATYTYSYNAIGNILTANGKTYSYSGVGKTNPHAVTAAGGDLYGYDGNGNVVRAPNQTVSYNWQNQPLTVVSGGQAILYAYDEAGERFIYYTPSSTEIQVSEDYLVRYGDPEIVIKLGGEPIGLVAHGSIYSTITDHLGSPVKQVSSSGEVAESTTYGPFGAILSNNGPLNAKRGYTGHEYDNDTGWNYTGARYYHPRIGRFLSQDPVYSGLGGPNSSYLLLLDPQGLNSYAYARNNPIGFIDPNGNYALPLALPSIAIPGLAVNPITVVVLAIGSWAIPRKTADDYENLSPQEKAIISQPPAAAGPPVPVTVAPPAPTVTVTPKPRVSPKPTIVSTPMAPAEPERFVTIDGLNWYVGPGPFALSNRTPGEINQEKYLDQAEDDYLRRTIEKDYGKNADVGDGGTADALREEKKTGQPTKGHRHKKEAKELIDRYDKTLRSPKTSQGDKDLARRLRGNLKRALRGK